MNVDIQQQSDFDAARLAVDNLVQTEDGVIIFYFHHIRTHSQISVQEGYLEPLLDYVIQKGVRVITLSEMYNYVMST